jgi:pimeloyl-ACP methyl ester carboxylesterase
MPIETPRENQTAAPAKIQAYAPINGLRMYYEVQGAGRPLLHIPMGFGVAGGVDLSGLARTRMVISLDLQGRARTADLDRPLTFEQQADDAIALLQYLRIERADLFGECAGGVVATLAALRYPALVGRIVTYGSAFGRFQDSYKPDLLAHVKSLASGPEAIRSHVQWNGFSRDELRRIQSPLLIAVGDHDWIRLEHAIETHNLIPNAELAIIPDAGHFALDTEPWKLLPLFEAFLDGPVGFSNAGDLVAGSLSSRTRSPLRQ